jgi:hypothetical protein
LLKIGTTPPYQCRDIIKKQMQCAVFNALYALSC